MFLNPQELLDQKIIKCTNPALDLKEHVQQNGLDVDCALLTFIPATTTSLGKILTVGLTTQVKPTFQKIEPIEYHFPNCQEKGWKLDTGRAYSFDSSFEVDIPEGMCGWLIGRSSFNRHGVLIRSALYDSGFKGTIGGTIYCFNPVVIGQNVRVAQLVLAEAKNASLYNGQYQS